jgi:N-(2-amino-2-carboxyethyl)-L-glutamate synthase
MKWTAGARTRSQFLKARLDRVQVLLARTPNAFWPNQYANLDNPRAHYQTMREIIDHVGRPIDYLFCPTSTCGTLRGCVEHLRAHDLRTKVFAVDAVGSVIFGVPKAHRLIPGHDAGVSPALFQPGLADECLHVSDLDCIVGCRRLVGEEAILAGGSSGGVVSALERVKDRLRKDATAVLIFSDRGDRYLDTIYSEEWVDEHFGDVRHLWANGARQSSPVP